MSPSISIQPYTGRDWSCALSLPLLEKQGFHAAYAGIALPNAGSIGIHEALGFTHIGTYSEVGYKHGQWHSVGYWRKPLSTVTPPTEIILFSDLKGD